MDVTNSNQGIKQQLIIDTLYPDLAKRFLLDWLIEGRIRVAKSALGSADRDRRKLRKKLPQLQGVFGNSPVLDDNQKTANIKAIRQQIKQCELDHRTLQAGMMDVVCFRV